MGNTIFALSQILAALAFLCGLYGYQQKEHNKVLISFSICSFLTAAHFALLESWTAAAVVTISGFRHLTALYTKKRLALYFFYLILALSTAWTYQEPVNLLAGFSAALGTTASFSKNTARARLIWMCSSASYVTHNYLVNSPVALIMEGFFLIVNFTAYRRHFWRKEALTTARSGASLTL